MADFDPFENQGGPAAWDPAHKDDSRERAEELLRKVGSESIGSPPEPSTADDPAADDAAPDADVAGADENPDSAGAEPGAEQADALP